MRSLPGVLRRRLTATGIPGTGIAATPDDRDRGTALIEFVAVSVVLLLPLVYLMLSVFTIQRAAFGVAEGARDAGRAISLAGSTEAGLERAEAAATLALQDQGVGATPQLRFTSGGCDGSDPTVVPALTPGSHVEVCVSVRVPLPFTGSRLLGRIAGTAITVRSGYLLVIPPYEPAAAGATS